MQENDDIYSVKILFRSIIEHFLRFQYIWVNHFQNGKEIYSLEYYTKLSLSETLNSLKSVNSVNRLNKTKGKTVAEMWADLEQSDAKFRQFSILEIENFSRNISIKNIITFLVENIEKSNFKNNDFLKDMILRYSALSSFVHGGIHAWHNIISYEKSDKRHNDLVVISGLALQAATFIKIQSFLLFYQR